MDCPYCNSSGRVHQKNIYGKIILTGKCNACKGAGELTTPYVNPIKAREEKYLLNIENDKENLKRKLNEMLYMPNRLQ